MKHALITKQQLLKHALIAEQQLLKTGKWPRQWPFPGFRFSDTCFRPDVSGYRVKRSMTYARTSIKTGCHHAAIQAVGSRHYAPCRGVTLLQSRQSQVVITHHATVSPCCNPGGRKSSLRTMPRCHPTAIQAVASRHSAEMRNPVKDILPCGCSLDTASSAV